MSEIIVGADGSTRCEDAIAFARRLGAATGASVTLTGVAPYADWPSRTASNEYRDYLHEETGAMLERLRERLDGGDVALRVVAGTSPARALHGLAESGGAGLIVIGSTHRGRLGRVMPGSTADRLLDGAPCPVAIVPRDHRLHGDAPISAIGVGYDGSDESRTAVRAAVQLAQRFGARLRVVRVFDAAQLGTPALMGGPGYVPVIRDLENLAREELERLVGELPASVAAEAVFLSGSPSRELVTQSEGVDLLLLGSRGYGPMRAVLLGGVSHVVVREAACPVIVLPRGSRDGIDALLAPEAQATA
jgi:nucleotide-binding universal stress UspA family protein